MKKLFILISLFVLSAQASASLEVRAHYGMMMGKPDSFNKGIESNGVTGAPDFKAFNPLGLDVIYSLPVVSFAFGARYEMFKQEVSGTTNLGQMDQEATGSRLSLLAGYRLLETPVGFVGVLAHIGVIQKMDAKVKIPSIPMDETYKGTMDPSYGVGVEAAATLGGFLIGGELGYTMLKVKSFKAASDDSKLTDSDNKDISMDLTGAYVKLLIGLSI